MQKLNSYFKNLSETGKYFRPSAGQCPVTLRCPAPGPFLTLTRPTLTTTTAAAEDTDLRGPEVWSGSMPRTGGRSPPGQSSLIFVGRISPSGSSEETITKTLRPIKTGENLLILRKEECSSLMRESITYVEKIICLINCF